MSRKGSLSSKAINIAAIKTKLKKPCFCQTKICRIGSIKLVCWNQVNLVSVFDVILNSTVVNNNPCLVSRVERRGLELNKGLATSNYINV